MKRLLMLFFSIVFLFGFVSENNTKEIGKELGVEILSQEKIDSLCLGKEFVRFEEPITYEGYIIGYDEGQNMLLLPQNLNKNFFHGVLNCPKEKLVFLEDDSWSNKQEAISSNQVFRLFRIGEEKYWMYNVYFTGMPIANLKTDYISEKNENYGEMWVYDPYSDHSRYQIGKCKFGLRGASSLTFPKPSYKIAFTEEDISLLGMRKDDDWILNSLYDDEGLIHNKVSYDLWKQIAASNQVDNDEGTSMEYIEVFVDNTYMGVYGLLERIDKKTFNLNEKDILYKGVDKVIGEGDFYLQLTEDMKPAFKIKYPEIFSKEHWEPLKEWVYSFEEKESKESEQSEQLEKTLNLENAIDYSLYLSFISGGDNNIKNTYYFADYQQDGTYRIIKVPWDLNMTWGNGWYENHKYHFNLYQEKYIDNIWEWAEDVFLLYQRNPGEVGNKLQMRWKELRKNIITEENIYKMLDKQFNYIHSSGAYLRNCMFWGDRKEYWSDHYIYDYTYKKIKAMDEYMEQLTVTEGI